MPAHRRLSCHPPRPAPPIHNDRRQHYLTGDVGARTGSDVHAHHTAPYIEASRTFFAVVLLRCSFQLNGRLTRCTAQINKQEGLILPHTQAHTQGEGHTYTKLGYTRGLLVSHQQWGSVIGNQYTRCLTAQSLSGGSRRSYSHRLP